MTKLFLDFMEADQDCKYDGKEESCVRCVSRGDSSSTEPRLWVGRAICAADLRWEVPASSEGLPTIMWAQ